MKFTPKNLLRAIVVTGAFALSACHLRAEISSTASSDETIFSQPRSRPDFVSGESVTTASGVVLRGNFGELAEKLTLSNGVKIEGVFYK